MGLERLGKQSERSSATWDRQSVARGSPTRSLLCRALVMVGRQIVHEGRGPMPLWDFSRRLALRLDMPHVPLDHLSDAVKATLREVNDSRLRVMATSMPGAGYVYDADDPDCTPVRR